MQHQDRAKPITTHLKQPHTLPIERTQQPTPTRMHTKRIPLSRQEPSRKSHQNLYSQKHRHTLLNTRKLRHRTPSQIKYIQVTYKRHHRPPKNRPRSLSLQRRHPTTKISTPLYILIQLKPSSRRLQSTMLPLRPIIIPRGIQTQPNLSRNRFNRLIPRQPSNTNRQTNHRQRIQALQRHHNRRRASPIMPTRRQLHQATTQ